MNSTIEKQTKRFNKKYPDFEERLKKFLKKRQKEFRKLSSSEPIYDQSLSNYAKELLQQEETDDMEFNFVQKFLETTKIVESPTSYLEWAAYVCIGGILRHNVYIDMPSRRTRITPNLYVLLVGDSAATRKSTPLKIMNYLLKQINNTKLIEGRASIQGVLKELGAIKLEKGKKQLADAAAILYSEELAAFLVKDPQTTGILTDLYDYKTEHDVILKTEDPVKLKHVCVTLFSATNATFLQDMFTKTDLYGGLVGRTIFIMEEKARHKDLGLRDDVSEADFRELINHLHRLSAFAGKVLLTSKAIDFMETWYGSTDFHQYESKTGFEHRAHTHALKLSIILAAAEEDFHMEINEHHCEKAVDIIAGLRKNYHKLVATVGFSQSNVIQAIKDITIVLFNNATMALPRETIFQMLFGRVDAETFDKALITLDQTGFIEVIGSNKPMYRLSEKGKEVVLGELSLKGKAN